MNARPAIGVDIGGTHTKIALVNDQGRVLEIVKLPTAAHGEPASFVARIAAEIGRISKTASQGIAGIGVAIAGIPDSHRTQLIFAPNLSGLVHYPLQQRLSEACDFPVSIEVDGNAAALAEHRYGSGRGSRRFLCLVIGTGLGGAMIVDGQPLRFTSEGIGDPGHVIVAPNGPSCTAGCRGCAEALVCSAAVQQRARDATAAEPDSTLARLNRAKGAIEVSDVIEAAKDGDRAAAAVLAETGRWLGLAMASLAVLLRPDRIAVAGGVAEAGCFLLDAANQSFREATSAFYHENVAVQKGELGWQAAVVGAAAPFLMPAPSS